MESAEPVDLQGVEAAYLIPGLVCMKLRGEHDLASKERLTEAFAAATTQIGVLVDLSECTFIDSTVIAVLLNAFTEIAERGGRLELVIPPEATAVARVAQIAGLAAILPVHQSSAAALASLAPSI